MTASERRAGIVGINSRALALWQRPHIAACSSKPGGVLKKELVAHLRRMRRSKYASGEGQGRGGDGEGDGARARGPGLPIAEQAAD